MSAESQEQEVMHAFPPVLAKVSFHIALQMDSQKEQYPEISSLE